MASKLHQHAYMVLAHLVLLCGLTSAAHAQTVEPRTLVVSEMIYVGTQGDTVNAARKAALEGVHGYLASWPEHIRTVSNKEVRGRLNRDPSFDQSRRIGEKWVKIGLTEYKNLKTTDAIESLEQAVSTFEAIGYPTVNRKAYAKALQYLALSYLDLQQPNPARPLELLKDMLRADPALAFRRGFYPDPVVEFFESSRHAIERDLGGNGPALQEAERLAKRLDTDFVAFISVLPKEQMFEVVLHVYDRKSAAYLPVERVVAESANPEDIQWASSQAVSRFMACIINPTVKPTGPVAKSTGESPWAVELDFAYMSFLTFPEAEVENFGSYGATFGASYLLTQEFGLTGLVQVLTSLRDRDGFIVDDFTTLRGFAGTVLGYSFGPVRTELGTLAEFATVGDITVCKDIDEIIQGCNDPDETEIYQFSALVGINVRPKVTLKVLRSLRLIIAASATFYIFPLSERALNFPLTGEAGFEYRF